MSEISKNEPLNPKRLLRLMFGSVGLQCLTWVWLISSLFLFGQHLWQQTEAGWTDGLGHPFGDDFINFWSAGRLSMLGQSGEVYNLQQFHAFEVAQIGHDMNLYHASYPPILLFLAMPLGLLPFMTGLIVWLLGGWFCHK